MSNPAYDDDDRDACSEYNELSRRRFLAHTAMGTGAGALASFIPAWLPKVTLAESYAGERDIIVSVFMRGGADGLAIVAPFTDPLYYTARPTIAIPQPDSSATVRGINLDGRWAFAPAMAPLVPAFRAGHLLLSHATGLTDSTRSHFDAQRYMEVGKMRDPSIGTGWLGRHLATVPPLRAGVSLRAIGYADGLQQTLVGAPLALPIPDPSNFNLAGSATTRATRTEFLRANYQQTTNPVKSAAQDALNTIALLNAIDFVNYRPANGAVYANTSFGRSMRSTAALIKADLGVEAVQVDIGGWDTHNAEDPVAGSMAARMAEFAGALGAFYADVIASGLATKVTVVCVSEFGRNVRENASRGTDHGRATVMFAMGRDINGGRVLTFNWPGLARENLDRGQDLTVTIDYRDLLAEIVQNRLGNPNLGVVFPGYTPVFRGVTR